MHTDVPFSGAARVLHTFVLTVTSQAHPTSESSTPSYDLGFVARFDRKNLEGTKREQHQAPSPSYTHARFGAPNILYTALDGVIIQTGITKHTLRAAGWPMGVMPCFPPPCRCGKDLSAVIHVFVGIRNPRPCGRPPLAAPTAIYSTGQTWTAGHPTFQVRPPTSPNRQDW